MPAPDLERAYADHADSVYAFALSLTRAEGEAQEVLQEVFVKLARMGASTSIHDLRAYLLGITHRCVVDQHRRNGARQRAVSRMSAQSPGWFAPTHDADTTAFRQALTAALAELPDDQRAVVHLKLWEGQTFAQIAALLELPTNTAASRYRYGVEKLRAALLPLYEEIRHLPVP